MKKVNLSKKKKLNLKKIEISKLNSIRGGGSLGGVSTAKRNGRCGSGLLICFGPA